MAEIACASVFMALKICEKKTGLALMSKDVFEAIVKETYQSS